jgi:predicted O-methyltransferase YrrM
MGDAKVRALLAELEAWGREHDASEPDHSRKMLNLEPDTARLISILVRSGRRTRLLEVGTSNGYSTVWLAWAARETGGRVVSIERSAGKLALAEANLLRAGLREGVELIQGDAAEVASGLSGPFDLVFLDADRRAYPALFELLLPKLDPSALVLADNALSHPGEIAGYLQLVGGHPGFEHMVIPVGKGLSLAYRSAAGAPPKETEP